MMNRDNRVFNSIALITGKTTLVASVYFLSSLLGFLFTSKQNPLPIIWPQAGVALAVTLLIGFDALPGIFVGSFLIAFATGVPVIFSIIVAVSNTVAAFFPAYFILNKKNFSYLLDDFNSLLKILILGVLISPVISATISILSMSLLQISPAADLPLLWGTRWLRDALGLLLFTPFLLVWFGNSLPRFSTKMTAEGIGIFSCSAALMLFVFFGNFNQFTVVSLIFLIIPIIIWAAIRLNIQGLVTVNLFSSAFFLWGVANKKGIIFNSTVSPLPAFLCILTTMWVSSLLISSMIIKYQKTQKSLSDLSNHDSLTNLFNRLFFDTELKRLENSRQFPITIIIADVDKLKEINDSLGHHIGDQVLKNIASIFSSVFRQEDIVSRIGGDEFVILLPTTGDHEAKVIIKRMNKQFDLYNKEHADLPINISIGVSSVRKGESLQEHLKIADNLMYEEKVKKKSEERIPFYIPTQKPINK
jgi:diguanylate cyclase (GGDEF)-like protein